MTASNPTPTAPAWIESPPPKGSFRSIFKWGDPRIFKHPSQGFFEIIKERLHLHTNHFNTPEQTGYAMVPDNIKPGLSRELIHQFSSISGAENIAVDTYSRLNYSSGKSMEDIFHLREGHVNEICDLVIHPRDKNEVAQILHLCHEKKIPIHVHGGGSSVTSGLQCPNGGITLVMGTHMNRMISFNETDQTITVEPGMAGPVYEGLLNNAPEKLGAQKRYTGGHFPQSFEYSSVGGWVVTLGSGQASSYYGDAADLVISQEYVTPKGTFKTHAYPSTATGPRVDDIMIGSEGCFGILVGVTFKVFEYSPNTTRTFAFMLPDFESAARAARQISQGRFGMPSILRISDPEETEVALKMYRLDRGLLARILNFKGMQAGNMCLCMGQTEGASAFSKQVCAQVKRICKHNGGMNLTGIPMKKWFHSRFMDPYMRDALNDYGILIDTLETAVTWDRFLDVYHNTRDFIKQHEHVICMTHASHFYAQGTNLYFIIIMPMTNIHEFKRFQTGIIERIEQNGGSLSHHHGVGRLFAPFMEQHIGQVQMAVLQALKTHFDPNGILNPGALGL